MVGSHVAHDCKVGNRVTLANNVALAGHVVVGDHALLGGHAAVRQFVRIGEGAMITGMSGVRADVIPWGMVQGSIGALVGLNVIGLKRRGVSKEDVHAIRRAYRRLFFGEGTFRSRLEALASDRLAPMVGEIVAFIEPGRPLTMPASGAGAVEE
jgi:UDP-N-acetylglucosamine acyltransferase